MLPARLLRVVSDGPATAPADGVGAVAGRMFLSWISERNWDAGPLVGMIVTTGVMAL